MALVFTDTEKERKTISNACRANKILRSMKIKLDKRMRHKRTIFRKYTPLENTGHKIGAPFTYDDKYGKEKYENLKGHRSEGC
jgi:hypothetical protein